MKVEIGLATLYLGDCLEILPTLPRVDAVITDPPYGISYVSARRKQGPTTMLANDNSAPIESVGLMATDKDFRITEFLHFCSTLMVKEPKEAGRAPCMIVFCEFEQQFELIEKAKKYGLNKYINLVFRKNFSAQVLKANMRVVGNCEYGLLLYRDKLPKFNNEGKMVFNCIEWEKDSDTPKIHPTQKPVKLLERLIRIFTDEGDVVIDPVAGSGSTLLAAMNCGRRGYGFEIKKDFYREALKLLTDRKTEIDEINKFGFSPTAMEKIHPSLFSSMCKEAS